LERSCEICRKKYQASRSTSRFCSSTCRGRAHKSPALVLVAPAAKKRRGPKRRAPKADPSQPPATASDTATATSDVDDAERPGGFRPGPVLMATMAELVAAEQTHTALGQLALALAQRVDYPWTDSGSATAAVAARLDQVLDKALSRGVRKADPLDELRARRQDVAHGG
jgi:hypothetical protein